MFIRPLDPVWGTDIKKGCSCIIADGYWMLSDLPDYGWMIKYEGQRQNVIEDQFNKWLENKLSTKYHLEKTNGILKTIIIELRFSVIIIIVMCLSKDKVAHCHACDKHSCRIYHLLITL